MKKALLIVGVLLIVVGVLTPLTTTVVTFLLPETFASSAKILHPASSSTPLIAAVGMMTTRSNLDLVVTGLNLTAEWGRKYKQPSELSAEKCREILKGMIQIQLPRGSSIVAIKVFSDNKVEAATIANKLTEVYCRMVPTSKIIEQAKPNPAPVQPNKRLHIILAFFVGVTFLVVGIGLLIASRLAVKRP